MFMCMSICIYIYIYIYIRIISRDFTSLHPPEEPRRDRQRADAGHQDLHQGEADGDRALPPLVRHPRRGLQEADLKPIGTF